MSWFMVFIFVLVVGVTINAADKLVVSGDPEFLTEISRHPNEAEPRYRYALYLFSDGRFDESKRELERLFTRHPEHKKGIALNQQIGQVLATKNKEQRKELQFAFLMRETNEDMKSLEATSQKMRASIERLTASSPPQVTENANRRDLLDKTYQISEHAKNYEESWEESLLVTATLNYLDVKDYDKAEALYKERIERFPKSSRARYDYISFLHRRGQIEKANQEIERAYALFSKDPEIRVLKETPAEKRTEAMLDISLLRLDAHKSKRPVN